MLTPLYQNPALDGGKPPGQVSGWLSCNSTCTAMLIAFETAGAKRPSGGDVRACTLNSDGSRDTTGGTRPSQNVDAARRCFGVVLDARVMPFEDAWRLGRRDDHALSVSISYAVISGTKYDGSPGFRNLHQVVLHGGLVYDPLADGRRPGIPRGPQPWPKDLLRRAAGKYAGTGEGRAAVIVGRAPIAKPKRYSVLFEPGAFWVYRDAGRVRDSFPNRTSAPCSAPFLVSWPGGRKRLVEITAGRLMGERVEPTATHLALKEHK